MGKVGKKLRIIANASGESLFPPYDEEPITAERLAENELAQFENTHVDAVFWHLGLDGDAVFVHNTQVGERIADRTSFPSVSLWRVCQNVKALYAAGEDPPAVIIRRGHDLGKEVFLSLRMNDCHDGCDPTAPVFPFLSRFRQEHPELLLGPPGPDEPYAPFHATAFDFAKRKVHEHRLKVIEEMCGRYDADGIELDFCRHGRFFRTHEAYRNRHIMTGLMRRIRTVFERYAGDAARPMRLAVRVPPTFEICEKIGLDVRTWLQEGLIDILTASATQNCVLNLPVEEFVEAARDLPCRVHAHMAPCPAGAFNDPIRPDYSVFTPEMFRAAALNYWRKGVDGLYTWNVQWAYFDGSIPDSRPYWQVGEPAELARQDKCYVVDMQGPPPPSWAAYGNYLIPPQQLPVSLSESTDRRGTRIELSVADDLPDSRGGAQSPALALRLKLWNLTRVDELTLRLNGRVLPPDRWKWQPGPLCLGAAGDYYRMNIPLRCGEVIQGRNLIEVALLRRNPEIACDVVLSDVALEVKRT